MNMLHKTAEGLNVCVTIIRVTPISCFRTGKNHSEVLARLVLLKPGQAHVIYNIMRLHCVA